MKWIQFDMFQKSSIFGVEYITKIKAIFWGEQQKIGVIISSFKYLFYNFMFSIMRADTRESTEGGGRSVGVSI